MKLEYPGVAGSGEIWLDVVRAICGDLPNRKHSSICDLMCHKAPYTPQLGFKDITLVDIQYRGLDIPNVRTATFAFYCKDVISFLQSDPADYDVMICSDGIEHLSQSQGEHMLEMMVTSATKSIIFTPLGDQSISNDKHPDSHKSGWTPESFANLLYNEWAFAVFPNFHPQLNCGAFFAWHCGDVDELPEDFERVKKELNNKSWSLLNS